MYTIGYKPVYEKGFNENSIFKKMGIDLNYKDGPYYGGICFRTIIEAREYLIENKLIDYDVYGLKGEWETDTHKLNNENFNRINKSLELVKLNEY